MPFHKKLIRTYVKLERVDIKDFKKSRPPQVIAFGRDREEYYLDFSERKELIWTVVRVKGILTITSLNIQVKTHDHDEDGALKSLSTPG